MSISQNKSFDDIESQNFINSELEQYGIWVKAEPQDILEEPEMEEFPELETQEKNLGKKEEETLFLSEEEEKLLENLDFPSEDEFGLSETSSPRSLDTGHIEEPIFEENVPSAPPGDQGEQLSTEDESLMDLSIEDFEEEILSQKNEKDESAKFDTEKPFDIDEVIPSELNLEENPEMEEEISEEPETIDLSKLDFSKEPDISENEFGGEDLEIPDINLEFDDSLQANLETQPKKDEDIFLSREKSKSANGEMPSEKTGDISETVKSKSKSGDFSSEILLSIVNELSTIKNELVTLKTQIASMKDITQEKQAIGTSSKDAKSSGATGFFDEEEDETIALTGDELDNILNTANFTEETIEAEIEPSEAITPEELPDVELLPENGIYAGDEGEAAIEEISLENDNLSEGEKISPDSSMASAFPEEDIAHVTLPPEDTSYLDQLESLDLDEESSFAQDEEDFSNIEIESKPEIEIDDQMTADESADSSYEDLKLSLDYPDVTPEEDVQDIVDAIPEIDFESPGDISIPSIPLSTSDDTHKKQPEIQHGKSLNTTESKISGDRGISSPGSIEQPNQEQLKEQVKSVLSYLDSLLESLPEKKIEEFANSEYFDTYKKLFEELGLV